MSNNTTNDTTNGATLFSTVLFNIPRHNLITAAAYQLLNANAKAKVDQMLQIAGIDAGNWGGWADLIKDNNPPQDTETKKFLQSSQNAKHGTWHYVNLPLESANYQAAAANGFTRSDDVIQMYKKCVRVLKNGSTRFSRVNALRLVGHLVGDIHQPLHIACGFIDDSTTPPTIVFDSQTIIAKNLKNKHDKGGGKISLPNAGNMHSFWDGSLSGGLGGINLLSASNSAKEKELVKKIYEGAKKLSEASAAGMGLSAPTPLEDLAQDWANESIKISFEAYRNIKMVAKDGSNYKADFKTTKDDYIQKFRPVILKQMKLAAHRLAELLNAIYP